MTNVNGWSAAMFAAGGGQLEALQVLIENGVDVNMASVEGFTPLMLAAEQVR